MSTYGYIRHSELSHHGILGQKWGKRNGPPYPLDPSAHSAQEKKLTGGKYSQGVKQNRRKGGNKSSGGSSSLSDEEKEARRKKVKTALKVGAGLTAAAALTAGSVYLAKHPELRKAALNGMKDLAINAGKNIKAGIKTKKLNEGLRRNALALRKNASAALKSKIKENIKNARATDKENNILKKTARKAARLEKSNAKKGILNDVSNLKAIEELATKRSDILAVNKDAIVKEHGRKAFNDLVRDVSKNIRNEEKANEYLTNRKSNTGIRGVAKKALAVGSAGLGVVGAYNKVTNAANNAINNTSNLMNNKYVRDAFSNNNYDDYYYDEYGNIRKNKR